MRFDKQYSGTTYTRLEVSLLVSLKRKNQISNRFPPNPSVIDSPAKEIAPRFRYHDAIVPSTNEKTNELTASGTCSFTAACPFSLAASTRFSFHSQPTATAGAARTVLREYDNNSKTLVLNFPLGEVEGAGARGKGNSHGCTGF